MSRFDAIRYRIPNLYGGPWYAELTDSGQWVIGYPTGNPLAGLVATVPDYGEKLAEFIAAARTDVPALLQVLDGIADRIDPCPPPSVDQGYDSCEHGVWPCPLTEAAWLARGLDIRTEVAEAAAEWRAHMYEEA